MNTKRGNIVPTPVISLLALKGVGSMNEQVLRDEMLYQISLSVAKAMMQKRLITALEFEKIEVLLLDKYCPYIGRLTARNA
jgi:hypothetical protein